jgi:hypothetical protein
VKADYKQKPLERLALFVGLAMGGFGLFDHGAHGFYSGLADLEYRNPTLDQIHAAQLRVSRFYNARPRPWRPSRLNQSRALRRSRRFDGNGRRTA